MMVNVIISSVLMFEKFQNLQSDWTQSVFIVSHASKTLSNYEQDSNVDWHEIAQETNLNNSTTHYTCTKQFNHPLYLYFTEYQKTLDSISHHQLWITLLDIGFP